jgi:DNA-binding NarL/FixJ family response regulator
MRHSAARTSVLPDPHPLWSDAVESMLVRIGVEVLDKATSPERALALISEHMPDLVVAELAAYGASFEESDFLQAVRERAPEARIIVLSSASDPARISRAFSAGVSAYVIKTAEPEDFMSAVRQSFNRSVFLARSPADAEEAPSHHEETDLLTHRESEILRLVAEGHTNAQMAGMLWVTEQTVKFHLSNVYRKLDVANRTEASRWAQLRGLLPRDREPAG